MDDPDGSIWAWFFAYGTLAPGDSEVAAREGWTADAVRGRLYDLGPYPALVDVDGPTAEWAFGYVRAVRVATLDGPLDDYEGVADGLYRRVETTTRSGRRAWVYEYAGTPPAGAIGPIASWEGPRVDWPVDDDQGATAGPGATVGPDG